MRLCSYQNTTLVGKLYCIVDGVAIQMFIYSYYAFILVGACLAVFFFALSVKSRRVLPLVCAALWLLPIIYEAGVALTCTGECNIRVDLLLLFPVEILVLTTISLVSWRSCQQPIDKQTE